MTVNQSSITGPNARPMRSVPKRWLVNSATRITTATGITKGLNASVATFTPSSALNTEIAGVMTPSP